MIQRVVFLYCLLLDSGPIIWSTSIKLSALSGRVRTPVGRIRIRIRHRNRNSSTSRSSGHWQSRRHRHRHHRRGRRHRCRGRRHRCRCRGCRHFLTCHLKAVGAAVVA